MRDNRAPAEAAAPAPARRRRPSRALEVQEAVKEIIVRRGLSAGDPLPTETELMEELDTGRNSVREALKALQAVGIVDIRHGFGMFVGQMSLNGLVDELAFHSRIAPQDERNHLAHLTEVREVLENGLAARLIDRHGADLAELLSPVGEVIAQMEAEALVGAVAPETDRRFHDLLYRPLGNPLVGRLLGAFWQVYHQLSDELGTPDETPEYVARKHRDIYTAVLARDHAAVEAAMSAHFAGIHTRLDRLRGA
ncbi:FCD domain-containing protein [Actinomadura sp. LD22]|uniref:FCD domain-containing protein n=1 Tax=Actinomadura physcomitrii TaxID=2650748 RepID=A0A6I4MJA3_9ACTN|nr:FCD domain-containing protein [Actinomadura physcomitrii]